MDSCSHPEEISTYVLIFFLSFILVQSASANSETPVLLLRPALLPASQTTDQVLQEQSEPFIKRTGNVSLDSIDIFRREPASLHSQNGSSAVPVFMGMHLLMSFFPEQEIIVIVDYESSTANNVISIGGRRIESDISTFSMTISEDNFLITYQDINNAMTYRVVGDVKTGLGKVTEIDLKKIPPRYDSEPVIPQDN